MYKAFYGLKQKPFSVNPDPQFLYFSRMHSYAYELMKFGIRNSSGIMVIRGDIGCGKTTLVRQLLNHVAPGITVGLVNNFHRNIPNLLEWIMLAFGLPYEGMSRADLLNEFQNFVIKQYGFGKTVLLIIDEAQNLTFEALESLRLLLNINTENDQLLQIMLVGQRQLENMLKGPDLEQFAQLVEFDFHIKPLENTEVQKYIEHRLAIAGRTAPLFNITACAKIAQVSRGIPRLINILCDIVLVYGFSARAERIDLELVDEVMQDRAKYGALSNNT